MRDGATGTAIVAGRGVCICGSRSVGDPAQHAAMRLAAREHALTMSWDAVFEGVYTAYEELLTERHAEAV